MTDVVGVRTRRSDYAMPVDEESLASLASDKDGSQLSYMLSHGHRFKGYVNSHPQYLRRLRHAARQTKIRSSPCLDPLA
jgi:hypothetical protein